METVLRADGVSFSYGGDPALENVSLSVVRGEFVALVGPNGSGKTTLLRILLGLLEPDSGSVTMFGTRPSDVRDRSRLGYVPQRPTLAAGLPATVEEIVATGRLSAGRWWLRGLGPEDRRQVDHALEAVGLTGLRKRRVAELSGGEQQRAFIARAVAGGPDLLILDEPVAGVDADAQRRFRDSLVHHVEVHGGSVLLVSHELGAVASDLDRVVVLKRTVRFDGPPVELARSGLGEDAASEHLPLWLEGLR